MRQLLLFCLAFFALCRIVTAQDISVRVRQVAFSAVDPDGAGPAKGSVTFRFELRSSGATVLADGMGLSVAYQSSALIATPANTVTKLGPINTGAWSQQVDNRARNTLTTPVTYGGQSFDRRAVLSFNQGSGTPDAPITNAWTPVAQVTYYTLGAGMSEGGYVTPEPGTVVAVNELSSEGGGTTTPYLSPEVNNPLSLSSAGVLPVRFVSFDAQCSPTATALTWRTASEKNNSHFEVEKSVDGNAWNSIGRVKGAGNGSETKTYRFTDHTGGAAQYRIRQVDRDGTATHSATVRTTCGSPSLYVNLYPVPARDRVTLVIGLDKTVKANVVVADNNGRTVMRVPLTLRPGTNSFTLNVSRLPQGQYYLQSEGDEVKIKQRLTIVR